MTAWAPPAVVRDMLGPAAPPPTDPTLILVCGAAEVAARRKRAAAGYLDDPVADPGPDVTYGTSLWAVALWRERGSTDGYASFEDSSGFAMTGGSWPQIKKLLGIPRAAVDAPAGDVVNPLRRRFVRWGP